MILKTELSQKYRKLSRIIALKSSLETAYFCEIIAKLSPKCLIKAARSQLKNEERKFRYTPQQTKKNEQRKNSFTQEKKQKRNNEQRKSWFINENKTKKDNEQRKTASHSKTKKNHRTA